MYELKINFLKDRDPVELSEQGSAPTNVEKNILPKSRIILFLLMSLGIVSLLLAVIASDLRLPLFQRGRTQDSTSESVVPNPTDTPTIGFVDLDDPNTATVSSQSVTTELEVSQGSDRVLKALRDVSGANKHQEALQNFFGDSREMLVTIEESKTLGGWKAGSPDGLALTIQYAFSSTELMLTQDSQTIYLNTLPTAVVVEYVGDRKLRLNLSVVQ